VPVAFICIAAMAFINDNKIEKIGRVIAKKR
jgi:hypothetical protein